jgi:hypothetical protein
LKQHVASGLRDVAALKNPHKAPIHPRSCSMIMHLASPRQLPRTGTLTCGRNRSRVAITWVMPLVKDRQPIQNHESRRLKSVTKRTWKTARRREWTITEQKCSQVEHLMQARTDDLEDFQPNSAGCKMTLKLCKLSAPKMVIFDIGCGRTSCFNLCLGWAIHQDAISFASIPCLGP